MPRLSHTLIRRLRMGCRMTLAQWALSTGVHYGTAWRWEKPRHAITRRSFPAHDAMTRIFELAAAHGLDPDTGKKKPSPYKDAMPAVAPAPGEEVPE